MVPGMLVLGAILDVHEYEVLVSLPFNMRGSVAISDVSDHVTEQVKSEAAKMDSDIEEEDDEVCVSVCGGGGGGYADAKFVDVCSLSLSLCRLILLPSQLLNVSSLWASCYHAM